MRNARGFFWAGFLLFGATASSIALTVALTTDSAADNMPGSIKWNVEKFIAASQVSTNGSLVEAVNFNGSTLRK
ncbi:hypothetical protein [Kiritimatiella glycovorans]|uniref:hypothetical protein n=1 Tax=Kiritimatiella glycovorans TaxID=1307763 RepID=UPI0011875619|nr:hypothetical protein [Kiritimatiella glycovorans]